jgi:hypothetical protein
MKNESETGSGGRRGVEGERSIRGAKGVDKEENVKLNSMV